MGEPMTWADILESSSRLHTTRTREAYPGGPLREDAEMVNVLVDGRPAQIVPTRMHEPGLYWRWVDITYDEGALMRSDADIARLKEYADAGKVSRV